MQELFRETTNRIKSKRASSPAMKALMDENGRLNGPPSLWLLSPAVGAVFEAMQGAIRGGISLSPRRMEIVVLAVGAHCQSEFEIYAHRMAAKAVGLSDAEVERLLSDQVPLFEDPVDRTVAETARAMLKTGDLNDQEYAEAVSQLGERGVFEITVLVGFYEAIALQLRVFRVVPE